MVLPSLFLTDLVSLLLFPDIVLVISYNLFAFRCPAAFAASVARALKNSLVFFLELFRTLLFNLLYLDALLLARHYLYTCKLQETLPQHSALIKSTNNREHLEKQALSNKHFINKLKCLTALITA